MATILVVLVIANLLVRLFHPVRPHTRPSMDANDIDRVIAAESGQFHPGPAVAALPSSASRSSLVSYAFVAIPLPADEQRPWLASMPSFCGDSTGVVCCVEAPGRPRVTRGACVVTPLPPPPLLERWGITRKPETVPATGACYPIRQ